MRVNYEAAKNWIYRNARPVDLMRWQYHFEGGENEKILPVLRAYQNADGGFGHALEADSWNPNSSPIQTWNALEVLREMDLMNAESKIRQDVLRYLDSGIGFADGKWLNTIRTNDAYPHASWWNWSEDSDYNPTAYLCGFILKYGERSSGLYHKAAEIADKAVSFFKNADTQSGHLIWCFQRLKQFCDEADFRNIAEDHVFDSCLQQQIQEYLNSVEQEWCCDRVAFEFLMAYRDDESITAGHVKRFAEYIENHQQADGSWSIPWKWAAYPEEWAISKNWWKANAIIVNLYFLKELGLGGGYIEEKQL